MKRERYDPEVVDLPSGRLDKKYEYSCQFAPEAWPDSRWELQLNWNNVLDRYCWAMRLLNYGQVVPSVPATRENRIQERSGIRETDRSMPTAPIELNMPRSYRDYIRFVWVDPADAADRPTNKNLGDSVQLQCWPGPDSESFVPLSRIQSGIFDNAREPLHDYLDIPTMTALQPGVP